MESLATWCEGGLTRIVVYVVSSLVPSSPILPLPNRPCSPLPKANTTAGVSLGRKGGYITHSRLRCSVKTMPKVITAAAVKTLPPPKVPLTWFQVVTSGQGERPHCPRLAPTVETVSAAVGGTEVDVVTFSMLL